MTARDLMDLHLLGVTAVDELDLPCPACDATGRLTVAAGAGRMECASCGDPPAALPRPDPENGARL